MWCKLFITHTILDAAEGLCHLGSLFFTTHSIHKEGVILQIYFCVIFCETRHHAQAHVTSGALIHCTLSLAMTSTQMAAQLG